MNPHPPRFYRTLLPVAAIVAAAGGLAGCGSSSKAVGAADASVTVPSHVPAGVSLRIADQLGSLQNVLTASGQNTGFPYKIEYSNFIGGPAMLQAFQAGAVDIGFVADSPLIFAQAAHQSIVGVAAWAPANGSLDLVTGPGVKLSGWAGLKGKKVAYQQGTVEEAMVLEGLSSVGLSLKDVSTVNVSTTSITPALESGSVDAAILPQPLSSVYLAAKPTASIVLIGNDITERVEFIASTASALHDPGKAAAIADYIRRLEKGYEWINAHPTQWAEDYWVKQYRLPMALATRLIAQAGHDTFLTLPGNLLAAQQRLADLYRAAGEIPSKVDVSSEFNGSFNTTVENNQ